MDTTEKLSPLSIVLHWLLALAMIAMLAVGFYMATYEVYSLYDWHKSFGVVVFVVALGRIVWRIKNGWPAAVAQLPAWQRRVARVSHWLLISSTLLMPISGMLYSGLGGWGIKVFGWVMVPGNKNPVTGQTEPIHAGLSSLGQVVHLWLGYVLVALVVIHMAAALKHHFIDKDRTLTRMLGR